MTLRRKRGSVSHSSISIKWGAGLPIRVGTHCFKVRGQVFVVGGVRLLRGLQNFIVYEKVVFLTNTGRDEASPSERILILTSFSHNFTREIQNQNMVPDFSVYFDVKSLLFEKINPLEISKPLHSPKLVEVKIFWHKCSYEMKKLVYKRISSSCLGKSCEK